MNYDLSSLEIIFPKSFNLKTKNIYKDNNEEFFSVCMEQQKKGNGLNQNLSVFNWINDRPYCQRVFFCPDIDAVMQTALDKVAGRLEFEFWLSS